MSPNVTLHNDVEVPVTDEMIARWRLAARRQEMTLPEWLIDVCQTASDPDSGQVVPLRRKAYMAYVLTQKQMVDAARMERRPPGARVALWERYGEEMGFDPTTVEWLKNRTATFVAVPT